jgi:ATP-dependent Clp protease ATP-binding subunit ClpC
MFERFTERARHVMVLAQEEARLLSHGHIGTEHLLLGVVKLGDGPAADVLAGHQVTLEGLRSQVPAGSSPAVGGVPFTPGAKRALERGLREALGLHHNDIEPEHLLLALTHDTDEAAARLLADSGVDPEVVRGELMAVLSPGSPAPRRLRLPRRPRSTPTAAGSPAAEAVCPVCGVALDGHLAYQTIDARPTAPAGGTRPVVIAYCDGCGAALGASYPPGPPGA